MSQMKLRDTWVTAVNKSGEAVTLLAPTLLDDTFTAIGRINQDLRQDPVTQVLGISMHAFQGRGILVTTPGSGKLRIFLRVTPDEFGCAGMFIDTITYIREKIQTDEQRAVLDRILINRLREREDKVLTLEQGQAQQFQLGA